MVGDIPKEKLPPNYCSYTEQNNTIWIKFSYTYKSFHISYKILFSQIVTPNGYSSYASDEQKANMLC